MDKNKTKRSLMRCCRNPELKKEGGNIEDGSVVVTNDIEIHDLMLLLPLAWCGNLYFIKKVRIEWRETLVSQYNSSIMYRQFKYLQTIFKFGFFSSLHCA